MLIEYNHRLVPTTAPSPMPAHASAPAPPMPPVTLPVVRLVHHEGRVKFGRRPAGELQAAQAEVSAALLSAASTNEAKAAAT